MVSSGCTYEQVLQYSNKYEVLGTLLVYKHPFSTGVHMCSQRNMILLMFHYFIRSLSTYYKRLLRFVKCVNFRITTVLGNPLSKLFPNKDIGSVMQKSYIFYIERVQKKQVYSILVELLLEHALEDQYISKELLDI